jgi:hypothetical protein
MKQCVLIAKLLITADSVLTTQNMFDARPETLPTPLTTLSHLVSILLTSSDKLLMS